MTYERWGTPSGREGIQRTLDPANEDDLAFVDGVRIFEEDGTERKLTVAEANAMGVRRCVAAKDIHTGKMRWREEQQNTPIYNVKAGDW